MLAALLLATTCLPLQSHDVRASPFDELRWNQDAPEVLVGESWYVPRAIDEISVEDILEFCDTRWLGQRQKRFGEDLIEVLDALGWEGDLFVELDLTLISSGEEVRLEAVEMTTDKRNAIRSAGRGDTRRVAPATLSRELALQDIDVFEVRLREQFAYIGLNDVDLDSELEAVRDSLGESTATHELARALNRVLMRFGDGHAGVRARSTDALPGDRYLPFLLADSAQGVIAFTPTRRGLVEPDAPVVLALDGRPLVEWLAVVQSDIAAGSPQLVRSRSLRGLREFDALRRRLGLEPGAPLTVTFATPDGTGEVERELGLSSRRPTYGAWPVAESRRLDTDIGYLRIDRMDDELGALRSSMEAFADTRGLIVDVRGNGGGSRELLLALAGYLIGPDEVPVVGNVAKYRLSLRFRTDHLNSRYVHRAGWPGWTDPQRAAIEGVASTFEPEWSPEDGTGPEGFSEWHYLVLDRTGHPREFAYAGPVVILSDAGCFSATDIFLGAMELLPQVTLLGTASSGGSARTESFRLPASGIEVRCASMASFRPDGRLYDGRGIEVDHEILLEPGGFLIGGVDNQLEAAVQLLPQDG